MRWRFCVQRISYPQPTFMPHDQDYSAGPGGTFSTSPTGVFTQIEQDGQTITVVKLQDAATPPELHQALSQGLGLGANAPLLVLRSEGGAVLDHGQAEALYNKYLSTKTDAVSEVTWKTLPGPR